MYLENIRLTPVHVLPSIPPPHLSVSLRGSCREKTSKIYRKSCKINTKSVLNVKKKILNLRREKCSKFKKVNSLCCPNRFSYEC